MKSALTFQTVVPSERNTTRTVPDTGDTRNVSTERACRARLTSAAHPSPCSSSSTAGTMGQSAAAEPNAFSCSTTRPSGGGLPMARHVSSRLVAPLPLASLAACSSAPRSDDGGAAHIYLSFMKRCLVHHEGEVMCGSPYCM